MNKLVFFFFVKKITSGVNVLNVSPMCITNSSLSQWAGKTGFTAICTKFRLKGRPWCKNTSILKWQFNRTLSTTAWISCEAWAMYIGCQGISKLQIFSQYRYVRELNLWDSNASVYWSYLFTVYVNNIHDGEGHKKWNKTLIKYVTVSPSYTNIHRYTNSWISRWHVWKICLALHEFWYGQVNY